MVFRGKDPRVVTTKGDRASGIADGNSLAFRTRDRKTEAMSKPLLLIRASMALHVLCALTIRLRSGV